MPKQVLKESYSLKSKIESFFTGNKIQISCDTKYIFSTCFDVLKVLDVSDGRVVTEIKSESEDNIITFGLSNDSKTIVIGHQSGLLKQWVWAENRLERTWKSIHIGPIAHIVFDSTDTLVATGGTDSTIKVWHIHKHYCTHNLRGANGVFSCVLFSQSYSDEKYYIYGSADDYSIHVWNLISSERVFKMDGHCSKVTAIQFSLDRQHILSCSRDKLVIVWNAANHQMIRSIPIFESLESIEVIDGQNIAVINSLLKNKIFLTAGEKGLLRIWNYETGDLLFTQIKEENEGKVETINSQSITQTIYCKEVSQIAVITFENNILFHKLEDLSVVKQFAGHIDEVLDIKILGPNESHIAVATNSSNIKIFELSTLNCYLLKGHSDIVLCLETFPSDPFTLISSSKDNAIKIWKFNDSLSDAICQYYGSGHTHSVTAIATPFIQTNFLVSGSEDTTLKIWKIPKKLAKDSKEDSKISLSSKDSIRAHEKVINSIAISPNDQLIASGSQDKTAKIWSVDGLKYLGILSGHRKGIWSLQFSPVDQVLATSSADATIKIWALSDYSCVKTFEGHDCSVLNIHFIDRGMQLLSSASDGNLKIWNIKSNECVKTIDAHNDKIWALTLSNNESLLVSGGSDSSVCLWNDVTAEEIEETAAKREDQIKSEQNLMNFIHKKKWSKALKLAIRLDHPFRALSIIKEILLESNCFNEINEILFGLREDQLLVLLDYSVIWNTNSKHYIVSQTVLRAIFHKISPNELTKIPEIRQKIEKLLPYNERHLSRLNRLQQSITFVDFVWQSIKLPELKSNNLIDVCSDAEDIEELNGSQYVTISDSDIASDNEISVET